MLPHGKCISPTFYILKYTVASLSICSPLQQKCQMIPPNLCETENILSSWKIQKCDTNIQSGFEHYTQSLCGSCLTKLSKLFIADRGILIAFRVFN